MEYFSTKKSNSHSLRMKYMDIIVNEKIKWSVCDVEVDYRSYEQHLDSKNRVNILNSNTIALSTIPIKCACGRTIQEINYEKHLLSRFHLKKIHKKIYYLENLKQLYAYRVNHCNCCVKCLATDIIDKCYNHELKLCFYCV